MEDNPLGSLEDALKANGINKEWIDRVSAESLKGYVYIIKCNEFYKIGCSRNGVGKRLNYMRTGNPYELEIVLSCEVSDYFRVEALLHEYYKDYRIRGEWFKLTDEQLELLKRAVANE